MSSRTTLIDVGLAVALAALLLVVAPGLGVVAIAALVIVVVCGVSFGIEAAARRLRRRTSARR